LRIVSGQLSVVVAGSITGLWGGLGENVRLKPDLLAGWEKRQAKA
jgi:hypothetical protein